MSFAKRQRTMSMSNESFDADASAEFDEACIRALEFSERNRCRDMHRLKNKLYKMISDLRGLLDDQQMEIVELFDTIHESVLKTHTLFEKYTTETKNRE